MQEGCLQNKNMRQSLAFAKELQIAEQYFISWRFN